MKLKLGYRIEGHCSDCRWWFKNEKRKDCARCGSVRVIHAYLITAIDPYEECTHEDKDDPQPKQKRYNNYKKQNKKKGR